MPQPTKAAPKGFDFDTSKPVVLAIDAGAPDKDKPASSAKGRPALSEEQLKGLKRSLPALEKSRIVEPLKATPHSRLARMSLCIKLPIDEATTALVAAYKRKKWVDLKVTTPKSSSNYSSFTGNSGKFRVNGSTSRGEFPKCKKSDDESRVSLSFQERQPEAKAGTKGMGILPGLTTRESGLAKPRKRGETTKDSKTKGSVNPEKLAKPKPPKPSDPANPTKPSGLR